MVPMKVTVKCCCSVAKSCLTLCGPMPQTHRLTLSPSLCPRVLKFILDQWCSCNHLTLAALFSFCLLSFHIKVFSMKGHLYISRWPKYWALALAHQSNDQCSRVDFFQDWLVLILAVQGLSPGEVFTGTIQGSITSSVHDYWIHSFDYYGQQWHLYFLTYCLGLS